jgi:hypothetical protein
LLNVIRAVQEKWKMSLNWYLAVWWLNANENKC